ncbi:MAG: hypothetical protein ACPGPE_11470, partial [Planctomycetota bacterium]
MPEDTAPTNRDFPLYVSCGAAPTSRKEESCRFCGAVLPWADFDLRSRRRLVLGFMAASAFLSMWINNTATTL